MKKQKKLNPRSRPATWADVEKAHEQGRMEGAAFTQVMILTVMKDKENATQEDVVRIQDELQNLAESIAEGYVNTSDLVHALKEEYDIVLKNFPRRLSKRR